MQISIFMINLLRVIFTLQFLKKFDENVHRLCLDRECSEIGFSAKLIDVCKNYSQIEIVDVVGKTSDDKYFIIKMDKLYFVQNECVEIKQNEHFFTVKSPLNEFVLFEAYIANNPLAVFPPAANISEADNQINSIINETIETVEPIIENKTEEIKISKFDLDFNELYKERNIEKSNIINNEDWSFLFKKPYYVINQLFMIWDPITLEQNLKIASFRNELYYQISIILFLIVFIIKFFKRNNNTSYHQIQKNQLEKLFADRIKILETRESDLKSLFDKKSKELYESNSHLQELREQIAKINENNYQNKKEQEVLSYIEVDGKQIPETITALKSAIDDLIEKIKNIQDDKDERDELNFENKVKIAKILSFIFNNEVFEKSDIDESLKRITELKPEQIYEAISNINEKIKAYQSNDISALCSAELKDLKEKYDKSLERIVKLEDDNKEIQFKKYEVEIELKAFKNHYKESENTLQEKFNQERIKVSELERKLESLSIDSARVPDLSQIIADLKFEISSLESKMKGMKDQHLLDLNQQYTINKKLEREMDRIKQEKEKYRSQLLKVLNDNQMSENEKDHVSESNFTPKTIISSHRRSEGSPIKSSFVKNEPSNFESMIPPPPPPPPLLFSVHQMSTQPFIPNETSSPRLENPNFFVSFTNVPSMPPFNMFGQEYDPNSQPHSR